MTELVTENAPVVEMVQRVLLVENESDNGATLKDWFERRGCTVDWVETRQDAENRLLSATYSIVVADVRLPNGAEGDSFVLDNASLMGGAKLVVITGNGLAFIARGDELERAGIPTFRKGDPKLIEALKRLVPKGTGWRADLAQGTADISLTSEARKQKDRSAGGDALTQKAHDIVVKWLRSMVDPDRGGIFYCGREYSPRMLEDEVRRGTPVGQAHINMLLDLIEHDLGYE